MEEGCTFVGLDAHKVAIIVAMLLPGEAVAVEWECTNDRASVRKMVRKVVTKAPGRVVFCYEAGPCGYALQRWIRDLGVECMVVAPSLIPRKPGERIKTDRRDARKLVGPGWVGRKPGARSIAPGCVACAWSSRPTRPCSTSTCSPSNRWSSG